MAKFLISFTLIFGSVNLLIAQIPSFSSLTDDVGIEDIDKLSQPFGYGAALGDYDNDGDIDFFLTTDSEIPNKLYQNDGSGFFRDVASTVGLNTYNSTNAALWVDYNNDKLLDLITVGNCIMKDCNESIQIHLFQQESSGQFLDVTEVAGISLENKYDVKTVNPLITVGGLAAGDINNDGYLDLLVTIWKGKDTFFLNNGDGSFLDISTSSNLGVIGKDSWQAMFYDFNKDGFQDIYLNIDFGPNEIWINNRDNTFYNLSADTGLDPSFNEMGLTFGDYDNDGDFDIYATNITVDGKYNVLLTNNSQDGNLSFQENAKSFSISDNGWDWGTTFFDANNDGWLDLAATNGYVSFPQDASKLWINNEGRTFDDRSSAAGFDDELFATSLMAFDMERDGDLDLLQTLKDNVGIKKPVVVYRNSIKRENGSQNYLTIKPRMTGGNHFAIGAVVKIKIGNLRQMRLISAGTSFYGQEPAEAFFGLGDNTMVDEVRIEWPDNTVTVQRDIQANQILTITNEKILDDVYGCTDFNSCNYNPGATIDDGSCSYYSIGDIMGVTESSFGNVEIYTLTSHDGSSLKWNVKGGVITDGQGTSTITVKWGIASVGEVLVEGDNENCLPDVKSLTVNLDIQNRPDKISIARVWNEVLLESIRKDLARPTVHARNLFHSAVLMYDIWAIYQGLHTYLLDNEVHGFKNGLQSFSPKEDKDISIQKAISYGMYRLLCHRFKNSTNRLELQEIFNTMMEQLGYDISNTSTDYLTGDAAAFGNHVAQVTINYGLVDNSRESTDYDNAFYRPQNPGLDLSLESGSTGIVNPDRWQPLIFKEFIDQSGNLFSESTPNFLSPEWGEVLPFSLSETYRSQLNHSGHKYTIYYDPGSPPSLQNGDMTSIETYKWNFELVSIWSSHLDPNDGVHWDISPRSIGNIDIASFPNTLSEYQSFYKVLEGGDPSRGYSMNPKTGSPYTTQIVPRGDYTRVLAEFWADGPDSETPPGHWFTILNYVSDHEQIVKKFNGRGTELSDLEWDIKSYFILGGAMHDAAIAAWGIKGWYDYIRPISAIRYICELGQSSDDSLPNYDPTGIKLRKGFIEVVEPGDSLAGNNNEHVGKIKLYGWRGHDYIDNANSDIAGTGWILAENWWPYQRPSFVTPPFAGFVSGHSTFSRAAAEVLTLITGDEFFPGGMGEFVAKKDEFLKFEKGPSVDVRLQWATYRDASDQTSLSRIWGGIHPPIDDIPGRIIGEKVGVGAYNFALPYFEPRERSFILGDLVSDPIMYPNPASEKIVFEGVQNTYEVSIFSINGRLLLNSSLSPSNSEIEIDILNPGVYLVVLSDSERKLSRLIIKR